MVGKARFSVNDSIVTRIEAFLVNLLVAGSQLFTVLFCLVGWAWSVWWGVMMVKMASKLVILCFETCARVLNVLLKARSSGWNEKVVVEKHVYF